MNKPAAGRTRDRELAEALERQTATAEILRVISRSPTDAQPVFDTIAAAALRLCRARSANVVRYDGALLHIAALANVDARGADAIREVYPRPADRGTSLGRAILEADVAEVPDVLADPHYRVADAAVRSGFRSVVAVPLLREGRPIGAIAVGRAEPGPFPASQVALLRTFGDQAVIAIENGRLFKELQDKSRELEIASRHKSAFLANMSHELRTPMNAIIGFTRLVMRNAPPQMPTRQLDNLHKILGSAQHLLTLINATLDLSRIEAGRIRIDAADVALARLLEDCLRTVEPLLGNGVRMRLKRGPAPPELHVDEEKLRQIVINLLSNAAKFTEHGAIDLRAQARGDRVEIVVSDTGIGIPADKLEAVFEEFEQVDAHSTRGHGGTGLGLAIARRLARAMGGELSARSVLGTGSTFTLELPLRWKGADEA